jgi:hypothetical protein
VADVTVAFQGWNSSSHGWGEGPWGEDVALPGAVGAIGTVSVTAAANTTVTGVSGTGAQLGTVICYR